MKSFVILVTMLFLFGSVSFAIDSRNVTYKSGDEIVSGVLYVPDGKGPFPAIIVIHEWWGLNDWVKQQANRLAEQGYVTLAVDLYRGKVAASPDEAHELSRALPEDRAMRDLKAAFQFLSSQPNVRNDRIGSIGWCMGGGYSLDLAVDEPGLAAGVVNYGHLATSPERIAQIKAPLLGIFGGKDRGIPPESVKKFEQEMKAKEKSIEVFIYPEAGHAFQNPNNKSGYRSADADDAWKKIVAFFARNLKH